MNIRNLLKILLLIAFMLSIPVAYFGYHLHKAVSNSYPPEILNYSPKELRPLKTSPAFYSIGNKLKFGNQFSDLDPTLYTSKSYFWYKHAYVSPDGNLLTLATNEEIVIVSQSDILNIINISKGRKMDVSKLPLGTTFFDRHNIQWSQDSSSFYIIENIVYERGESKRKASRPNRLLKYNLQKNTFNEVIEELPKSSYFLSENGIYFVAPKGNGDLLLKFKSNNGETKFVNMKNLEHIKATENIFYNFQAHDYAQSLLNSDKIRFEIDFDNEPQIFYLNERNALETTKGKSIKGSSFALSTVSVGGDNNIFTTDFSYFVLNVSTKQFKGQLLFNTETLEYSELPQNFNLYQNTNASSSSDWEITSFGIEVPR